MISCIIIESIGRKKLLITGNFILVTSLALFIFFKQTRLLFLFLFMFGYGLGSGPVVWLYLADILPGYGIGFTAMIGDIIAIGIAYFYP